MIGKHILAEFYGCSGEDLDNPELLEINMIAAANEAKATVCNVSTHEFEPQGFTCLLLLAESHMSIHTYPELGYAALDFFTCGNEADPELALEYLISVLKPVDVEINRFERGDVAKASQCQGARTQ